MKTSELLKKHNFKFKKRFGQNFITDVNLLHKIVDAGDISKDDIVLEIGPGAGTLTKALAAKAKAVVAMEIDRTLIPILEEQFGDYQNIKIVNEDALQVNFDDVVKKYYPEVDKYKIISNLPYYITTPLLFNALENSKMLSTMIIMVQKEVGERLQAKPGTKDYGVLTIMVNYYAEVTYLFTVSKKLFSPEPEVDSAIIKLQRHDESPHFIADKLFFKKLVKTAFSQRRKTFLNAIKTLDLDKEKVILLLKEAGHGEKIRGEDLSLDFFVKLSNEFSEK